MKAVGIRLLPAFLSVGAWTMVSRVLGLARDIVMAALLGTGPVAQAFLIAFTLPNMFRRFFAEGAFNLAFVPMFAKKVEAGEDAEGFARDALSGLATVLIVFTLLGQLAMPWLVLAMASGFAGDERFTLSVEHGRIAFPYILFISLTALLSGVLNSFGRFALAAVHVGILWPGGIVRRGIALLGRQKIPARRDHEWRPLLIINVRLAVALEAKSVHDAAREFLVPRSFVVGCTCGRRAQNRGSAKDQQAGSATFEDLAQTHGAHPGTGPLTLNCRDSCGGSGRFCGAVHYK